MKGRWLKQGRLYSPPVIPPHPKLYSHAANPLAVHLKGDLYRIYFSARDEKNRSSVGAVDIDIVEKKIVQEFPRPFFEHGPEDSFYADGVSIGNCYSVGSIPYILFMGWSNPPGKHWYGLIGRLRLNDDLSLELDSSEPFMGLDKNDPISLSYPWVLGNEEEGFRMWYGSTLTWEAQNREMVHVIKYATSSDGLHWQRKGQALPYQINHAQAFSRPSTIQSESGKYHMWYSVRSGRGETYRIAHAESSDGEHWETGEAGIDVSESGWDSEMIEYPFVFRHKGKYYMLYNGNGYGYSGFGLAVLDNAESL